MMKNIVFIALQLSQPRCIKRITAIYSAGIPIKIYGFDSGLYNENLKDLTFPIERLIKRDKNISRIKKIISFAKSIHQILHENNRNCIFYLFGFEITAIAKILGCKNYIYEEADISATRIKNPIIRQLLIFYDKFLYRKAQLVISTSEGFIKYLFGNKEVPKNIILQPNKLNTYFTENIRKAVILNYNSTYSKIKFGFVGLIRYPNTIIRFAKIIGKKFPEHEFHFYGDTEKQEYIDNELLSYKNIFFHGHFKNPQDLLSIYNSIDINVVCYDTKSENVKIAEPNKLYESVYFYTPIVVSKGTFLAEKVKSMDIGFEIDCSENQEIYNFIKQLTAEKLQSIITNMTKIHIKDLIDDPTKLINNIKEKM